MMPLTTEKLILTLVAALVIGGLTGYFAKKRARDPKMWFLAGFMFGLFGLIVLLFLPDLSVAQVEDEIEVVPEPVVADFQQKQWFYLQEQDQKGPVDFATLQTLWDEKNISSTTYVWCEGMEEWKTVQDCRLFTS